MNHVIRLLDARQILLISLLWVVIGAEGLSADEEASPETTSEIVAVDVGESLGIEHFASGDPDRGLDAYQRAFEIQQKLAANSLDLAISLNNLAFVAQRRGDLEQALNFHQLALEIWEKLAPDSLLVAYSVNNLGRVARDRGNLARATRHHKRALKIWEKLAPDTLLVAYSWNNLGRVAWDRGNLAQATDYHQRALKIQQRLAPAGLEVAQSLNNLGRVARERGDLSRAMDYHQRALKIQQELARDSLLVATSLSNLGSVASARADLDRASDLFQRALEIRQALAPGSVSVAETLHAIGLLHRQRNPPQLSTAAAYFRRALDTLESQLARLGGSYDVRAGFRTRYGAFYRHAIEVQLERNKPYAAFQIQERFRGRSFLEQLAERDTVFAADIPEELDRQRRDLALHFDAIQQQLAQLKPRIHTEQIEDLHEHLRRLRDEAQDVEEKIRRASPRLADLQYPQPFDLEAARSALDPGTLMLSFCVGEDSTVLFAVSKEQGLGVDKISISEEQLRDQVQKFRRLPRSIGKLRTQQFEKLARTLYATLIESVEDRIEESERLLILADGPLHYLPWGALPRDTPDGGQYLAEWKPLHMALSATVFAELRMLRREDGESPPPIRVVAFGDPRYPAPRDSAIHHRDAIVRSSAERVLFDWEPLPHTRHEVEGIAAVYPTDRVRVYLGPEATEERAKSLGRDVRILHFATHGYLDERFPLNSFLVLAIPEEYRADLDNSLLQAWEIFERVRLDADLVVLSACQTALGEEQGGEGLIGLTRAYPGKSPRRRSSCSASCPDWRRRFRQPCRTRQRRESSPAHAAR
ncbi:MAG: tetratricopeptide repeat protein [bacterium]|nr:tetratricopeptide repeat protein [bacterium]